MQGRTDIFANAESPTEFENEFFKGRMLFLLKCNPPNPKVRRSVLGDCCTICTEFIKTFHGSDHGSRVGSVQGDPARPVICENLLTRPEP